MPDKVGKEHGIDAGRPCLGNHRHLNARERVFHQPLLAFDAGDGLPGLLAQYHQNVVANRRYVVLCGEGIAHVTTHALYRDHHEEWLAGLQVDHQVRMKSDLFRPGCSDFLRRLLGLRRSSERERHEH